MWRSAGGYRETVIHSTDDAADTYHKEELCWMAEEGGRLIQCGWAYPALREFREGEMRVCADHLSIDQGGRALYPAQYREAVGILDLCVRPGRTNPEASMDMSRRQLCQKIETKKNAASKDQAVASARGSDSCTRPGYTL